MGGADGDEEGAPPADLAGARGMIGLLEVLERKTKGNRTPEEEQVLNGILYELRMAYWHAPGEGGRRETVRARRSRPFWRRPLARAAAQDDKVIDVRAVAGARREQLRGALERVPEGERARRPGGPARRVPGDPPVRIERNIRSLEPIALARVGEGLIRLGQGDVDRAEEDFRAAIALDPHLPDAYFGLAQRAVKKGPLGILAAVRDTFSGLIARLPTAMRPPSAGGAAAPGGPPRAPGEPWA